MTDELVHYGLDDGVATITLDSPHNRNALSRRLVTELFDALDRAEADEGARVVLVRSADRVFCSGADLTEAAEGGMQEGAKALAALQRKIVTHSRPVVTRLAGPVRECGRRQLGHLTDRQKADLIALLEAARSPHGGDSDW